MVDQISEQFRDFHCGDTVYHELHPFLINCLFPFWQICSGVDDNAVGACSELVFAPIDEMFPDDAPLLPSGFRVIPLESKSVESCFACLHFYYIYNICDHINISVFLFLHRNIAFLLWIKLDTKLL